MRLAQFSGFFPNKKWSSVDSNRGIDVCYLDYAINMHTANYRLKNYNSFKTPSLWHSVSKIVCFLFNICYRTRHSVVLHATLMMYIMRHKTLFSCSYWLLNSAALELIKEAIAKAGYTDEVVIGMDVAASEFYREGKYDLDFKSPDNPSPCITPDELADLYKSFVKDYPGNLLTLCLFTHFLAGREQGIQYSSLKKGRNLICLSIWGTFP